MSESEPKRIKWIGPALAILPLWLVVSAGVALWYSHTKDDKEAEEREQRFVQAVSIPLIADDLRKITTVVGERHTQNEDARKNLTRAAAMIDGVLGPSNTGYQVKRLAGPAEWPILQVSLTGTDNDAGKIWVLTSYDSRPGSIGSEANATGVTATLAAAQAMSRDTPKRDVHFLFLPHINDLDSPVLETLKKVQPLILANDEVLCIEAVGKPNELWLSSRNTEAKPLTAVTGLGQVVGAEVICLGENTDLASMLNELGISATRVSTRPILTPDEPDNSEPNPTYVAASAGRIIELIRRCSALTENP